MKNHPNYSNAVTSNRLTKLSNPRSTLRPNEDTPNILTYCIQRKKTNHAAVIYAIGHDKINYKILM